MIYHYVIIGFNSLSNLVVFVQSFPCILWDFIVIGLVKLVKIAQEVDLATWLASGATHKSHMKSTCWKLKSQVFGCIS